ncbi:MAG: type I restriction endonuclease [Chloroflexota bacterium]
MPSKHTSEEAFETAIEQHLLDNGYQTIASDFDRKRALFPDEVIAFIRDTQPKTWTRLEKVLGEKASSQLLQDLCTWIKDNGVLSTLRHGFKCYGRQVQVAYFKAAHGLNPTLEQRYVQNRVAVKRQLYYSERDARNLLDMVLILNGIPLVTLELKNPFTEQTVTNAKSQYIRDRDARDPIFAFKERTLVHFALDTEEVWMTTQLKGKDTYFLPFNRGHDGGKGNPPDPSGENYRTTYLWEEVLQRDSFLDLFAAFLHLEVKEKTSHVAGHEGRAYQAETMIFPRYHQLKAVRNLVNATVDEGPGHNYLIEHSAGSGKTNTIAWLAHRLSSLHTADDQRIFDSVVVISDRTVLDEQLRDTIYQFDHVLGVVHQIDKHSRQLAEALRNQVPIIVTTLQKFSYVSDQLVKIAEEQGEVDENSGVLATRRYAVLVDEAHSSQSGETAADLRGVLGGQDMRDAAKAQAHEDEEADFEELYIRMAMRARQTNLSFFAFTATPKHKTVRYFGRADRDNEKYTMRQAIEEGFIMDVLRHYTTYKTYYKLNQQCADDPNVEHKQAAKALARFLRLHPHNIAQKTEVMVEHFNTFTRHKIGGRAKAMVVTGSRLEAVRYKEAFDDYIKRKSYDIKSLVAFSGVVHDDKVPNKVYTEVEMNNKIRETALPEKFASPEYQVLLVADKYQTGFDQPLLHTMYVDKKLSGLQAVQTLSRLNRTHAQKEDTFILDFVNDPKEIQAAFQQYYEGATIGDDADPAQLYRLKGELEAADIYRQSEVDEFCMVYFKLGPRQRAAAHKKLNAILDPAVDRFKARFADNAEEAAEWRKKVTAFRNLYSYLSQLIPYQDSDLEKSYIFLRYLVSKLPRQGKTNYDFDSEVALEYYRLQKISEGAINLKKDEQRDLYAPTAVGTRVIRESRATLSQVIDTLNERFGTDFTPADQLFFDQVVMAATESEDLQAAAQANTAEKFALIFKQALQDLLAERIAQNEEIFARFMTDSDFREGLVDMLSEEVYRKLGSISYM